jgi:hypothetical protein
MARIYAGAARVIVWLGEEADGSSEAMDKISAGSKQRIPPKLDVTQVEAHYGIWDTIAGERAERTDQRHREHWQRLLVDPDLGIGDC